MAELADASGLGPDGVNPWEFNSPLRHQPPIAQLAEQLPLKQLVGGSNPPGGTKIKILLIFLLIYFIIY